MLKKKYVAVIVFNGGQDWHQLTDQDKVVLVEPWVLEVGDASTIQAEAVLSQRIITGMVQPIKKHAVREG
jgi:hypothetical protein